MKKTKTFLIIMLAGTVSFGVGLWLYSTKAEINPLMLVIAALIVIIGIVAIVLGMKRMQDEKKGLPADDELSNLIKYKAGYYAYIASIYMWLFIFLFKGLFPDIETMLGGGILLSGLIGFIAKYVVKQKING
jgi:uncharacterized membrane protein YidH (DUF202 family)